MRTVILVGLILHLVIAVVESYQFGDIISFPRRIDSIKLSYKHFGVYVGPQPNVFGQGFGKDIFHRIRDATDGRYCVFGSLAHPEYQTHRIENYLDGKLNKASDADIIKHVSAMMEHCGKYDLFRNNCEHLATYVRYGRAFLYQPGTSFRFLRIFCPGGKSCPIADEAVRNIPEEEIRPILERLYANSEIEAQSQSQAPVRVRRPSRG